MNYTIDTMNDTDWQQVRSIYLQGIATGHATFETDAPSWQNWNAKHLQVCRVVARSHDIVVGWAALGTVSDRCVYAGVAEVSVYVAEEARGQGVGYALLSALIGKSENHGIWTLQSGVFPENKASISLHLRCGFREVGRRERLGKMGGIWRDVVLLERRSKITGVD